MVISKRHLIIAGVLAVVCAVFISGAILGVGEKAVSAAKKEIPIYRVERDDNTVALTFDAAWGAEDTQQIIDELAKYQAKATIFVVGDWVKKYPEAVKMLHDAGHAVMNHSDTHPHMAKLTGEEVLREANAASDKIEAITGIRPRLLRVPYGEYNDSVIRTLRDGGYEVIQWDVDSLDWKDLSAGEIVRRVTGKASSGSIILFHNAAKHTPEALPEILRILTERGLRFVGVEEMLYRENYYINHTGAQRQVEP